MSVHLCSDLVFWNYSEMETVLSIKGVQIYLNVGSAIEFGNHQLESSWFGIESEKNVTAGICLLYQYPLKSQRRRIIVLPDLSYYKLLERTTLYTLFIGGVFFFFPVVIFLYNTCKYKNRVKNISKSPTNMGKKVDHLIEKYENSDRKKILKVLMPV